MKNKVPCSQRLKEALQIRNMKQIELCEKTKIPKSAMSQYIKGNFEPKQERVELLADALQVSQAWLMGYDVPMELPVIDPEQGGYAGWSYYQQYEGQEGLKKLQQEYAQEHIFELSSEEAEHLRKYRCLTQEGKEMVDMVLDKEYSRCNG